MIPIVGTSILQHGRVGSFNPLSLSPSLWFDFSDLTTLFQDTGGTSPVTADGQAIRRINDKSGNGNNATQSNLSNAPRYAVTTTLNLPAADFQTASNHYLSTGVIPLATSPLTLFFAGKSTENSISDQQVICYLSNGVPGWLLNMAGYAPGVGVGNPYAVAVGSGGYPGDICLAAGIQAETPVWAATYNPATTPAVKLYSGGVDNNPTYLIDNLVPNQAWNNNTLDIGGNVPYGLFYVGYVGEVVLYNQLLSVGQIAGVSQYLKNKWGST